MASTLLIDREEEIMEEVKPKRLTKIEKLIAPHSFQPEFKECLANIERKNGFELFNLTNEKQYTVLSLTKMTNK